MKRSKPLSALILIALALLLSAAKDGSGASRNPRGKQHKGAAAEEPKGTQQREQEPTVPLSVLQATQSALSEALRTIQAQEEAAAKHNRPQKDNWDKATVIADYLLFVVGCLYTYFAWGQWGVALRSLNQLEVPYVSIGQIIPHVLAPRDDRLPRPLPIVSFQFNFRNHGRSVAEVTSVHSQLYVVDKLPMPPDYSGNLDLSAFPIGPNSDTGKVQWEATYMFPTGKADEEFWLLLTEAKQLVCFGHIRYVDVFGTKWISGFGWRWYPHNDGVYLVGGSDYNYNRKDQ